MSVIKRTGLTEVYSQRKIVSFLGRLAQMKPILSHISTEELHKMIGTGMPDKISADDMLKYVSSCCSSMSTKSYDYAMLAGRVETVALYRCTPDSFTTAMESISDILDHSFLKKIQDYDFDQHIDSTKDFS